MSTAYISGHLKISKEEFAEHYVPKIDEAIKRGDNFIVCDARGVDTMAQTYLRDKLGEKSPRVMVYHMMQAPRNFVGGNKTVGGFKTDTERDAACTYASDYDIAWVRPGRTGSGTEKNLYRRKEKNKGRTRGYWEMDARDQWAEDKRLGILDWDGN